MIIYMHNQCNLIISSCMCTARVLYVFRSTAVIAFALYTHAKWRQKMYNQLCAKCIYAYHKQLNASMVFAFYTHAKHIQLITFNLKVKCTHAVHMQLIVHFVFAFCTDTKRVQPVFK